MPTIVRPAFTTGQRVFHTSDPDGEHGTITRDNYEGQPWVLVLWDGQERAHQYPTELIRPVSALAGYCVDSDGIMRAYYSDGSSKLAQHHRPQET